MSGLTEARYTPQPLDGADLLKLTNSVTRELRRISATYEVALARSIEFLHVAPSRVYDGLTVGADGTDWNPGSGQGVYTYYNGTWNKLG